MTNRRLLDAHMRRVNALRDQTVAGVRKLAETYGFDSDEFVAGAVETVLAGQTEEALATWSHLSLATALADPNDGGEIEVEAPVELMIGSATRAGTPLETIYHRPGIKALEYAANGMDVAEIFDALAPGVDELVSTDVAMAGRNAEQTYGSVDRRIVGWRRVPNVGACKWCRYIATQRYKKEELAPAHKNCHCGTEPIIGRVDPGQIIDPDGLAAIKRGGAPKRTGRRVRERASGSTVTKPPKPIAPVDVPPVEVGDIAKRIEADRTRAREILDTHKSSVDPGTRPRLPSTDPTPAELDVFRRDLDEYNARVTANRGSSLRNADFSLSTEGDELLDRLGSVGSEVLTEARGRVTNLDGLKDAALRAEQMRDVAATEALAFRTAFAETRTEVRDQIAREKFGKAYGDLAFREAGDVRNAAAVDPVHIRAYTASDDAAKAAAAAREEYERVAGVAYFAERDAILEVLEEIRPRGSGSDLTFVKQARSGESKAIQDAIRDSAQYYPEDWTKNLGETRKLIHKKVERGFQRDNRNGTIDIALSKGVANERLGLGAYDRVAVHELAHAMESTNQRVTASEWVFYKKRTAGLKSEPCWPGASERGIRDGFPDVYFGKSYGSELDSHKELLSMSMEHLVSASAINFGKQSLDDEHLAWLLGTWVTA